MQVPIINQSRFRSAIALLFCIAIVACLPDDRLNSSCEWRGDSSGPLNLADRSGRQHLELDARLAEDLGIRYGDSFRQSAGIEVEAQKRLECTRTLLAIVAQRHSLSAATVEAARGARDRWVDVVLVFMPMIVIVIVASRLLVRRVDRAFDADDRWLERLSLIALTPIVGAFGLMAGEQWEWLVEWARLKNAHLSYRAFRMPITHDAFAAWVSATLLFILVSGQYFLTTRKAQK